MRCKNCSHYLCLGQRLLLVAKRKERKLLDIKKKSKKKLFIVFKEIYNLGIHYLYNEIFSTKAFLSPQSCDQENSSLYSTIISGQIIKEKKTKKT